MKKIGLPLLLLTLAIFGCRDQKLKPVDKSVLGTEYFPLSIGNWWIYRVDSILFDLQKDKVIRDTVQYTVKHIITDTFLLGDDVLAYKLERFQRMNDQSPWQSLDDWWMSKDPVGAWVNEGNLLFQKLAFPVQKNTKWLGNAKIGNQVPLTVRGDVLENAFEGWKYKYLSVDVEDSVFGTNYPEVATVQETNNAEDFTPVIALRQALSKYAKNIGLIYKKWTLLDDIGKDPDVRIPFEQRAEEGFIIEQTLLDYHTE